MINLLQSDRRTHTSSLSTHNHPITFSCTLKTADLLVGGCSLTDHFYRAKLFCDTCLLRFPTAKAASAEANIEASVTWDIVELLSPVIHQTWRLVYPFET